MKKEKEMPHGNDSRDRRWEELRERAEELAQERIENAVEEGGIPRPATGLEEVERIIHELHVRQIELELQNEELLRARADLEEMGDRYKELYDFAPVGYVTLDTEGWIHQANLTFAGMLQRERARLERGRFRPLVDPGDQTAFDALLARCRRGERGRGEVRLVRKDESRVWALIHIDPLPHGAGPPDEIRLTATDISRRKGVEQALLELNETLERRVTERTGEAEHRAEQLRRLALELSSAEDRERNRIATILHDDLQQMLVSLKFQIHRFQASSDLTGHAADSGVRLEKLVEECVRKTRALSYELSPPALQPNNLVPVFEWLALDMEQNYGLEVRVDIEPGVEIASPELASFLYRSVRELLFNTVKHAGAEYVEIGAKQSGKDILITVRDRGRGMDIAEAKAGRDSGEGFGLFSIEERVVSLGGRLEIDSAPDAGCTVTLSVPLAAGRGGTEPDSPSPPMKRPKRRVSSPFPGVRDGSLARILVVDDHAVVREGLVSFLEGDDSVEVIGQAADGQEAVRFVLEFDPDIVLMDISMPEMDGITATREIKNSMPHVRVIGLSMHDDPGTRAKMMEAGATDFLSKSDVGGKLVAAVKRCLIAR